ncbi:MAG: hypothetical protein AVDCRST_MAG52-205, partial [uncultured Blastococcus sp.]
DRARPLLRGRDRLRRLRRGLPLPPGAEPGHQPLGRAGRRRAGARAVAVRGAAPAPGGHQPEGAHRQAARSGGRRSDHAHHRRPPAGRVLRAHRRRPQPHRAAGRPARLGPGPLWPPGARWPGLRRAL